MENPSSLVKKAGVTLAVFASDKGPGDPERSSIMTQVGKLFASKGARLVCLVENGALPVPLVTGARSAGGDVLIVSDNTYAPPSALKDVPIERYDTPDERLRRMAEISNGFVGLPGSLASAASLFNTWVKAGGGESGKPVALLNRHNAFEVLRGYSADILSHDYPRHDKSVLFAETPEDLWNRLAKVLGLR